ncbi:MAG: hypothetical protein ACOX9C_12575 [Kiritimatiellia bacterium]|jgi:hypothetical protein
MDDAIQKTKPGWRTRFLTGAARMRSTRAEQEEAQFISFIARVVRPAFSEIARRLAKQGRVVSMQETRAACGVSVTNGTIEEIGFRITSLSLPTAIAPEVEVKMHERKGLRIVRKTVPLRRGETIIRSLADVASEDIVEAFFFHYADALARLEP